MHNVLQHVLEQATGLKAARIQITIRPPLDFQSNRLYDVWVNGRHLIAKEFLKQDEWQDAPAREFQALQLLEPLDIAPRPVFYDPALAPVVVYEFMDGEMWDRKRPSPHELAQLAQLWTKMHAIPTEELWSARDQYVPLAALEPRLRDSFQRYAAWTAVAFTAGQDAAAHCFDLLAQIQTAAQELTEYPAVRSFCRLDNRFANVIRRPDGRLGLVDWEDSGLHDPARDLADLITHANQEDLLAMDGWQSFLTPFLAARTPLDPTIQERCHFYMSFLPVIWLTILLDAGLRKAIAQDLTGWRINDLPANERLRRYLARAQAWPDLAFHNQLAALDQIKFFPCGTE
jgi:aminoglycoside phosphotransferase (APT) family kinase protein